MDHPAHQLHILIIVRHGQSEWNLENRFTGWKDVGITEKGRQEARQAADKLKTESIDIAYTSALKRAHQTLEIILRDCHLEAIPVIRDPALNERSYGDLEGLNKADTEQKFGSEQVHLWRRSFDIAPPHGESLKDTAERVIPYFEKEIRPKLEAGKNILVVAHGNSLRALMMYLEKLSPEEILQIELPTGVPRKYELDDELRVLSAAYL